MPAPWNPAPERQIGAIRGRFAPAERKISGAAGRTAGRGHDHRVSSTEAPSPTRWRPGCPTRTGERRLFVATPCPRALRRRSAVFRCLARRHGGGPAHPFGCPSWTVPPSFDELIGCIFDRMLDVILVEDGGLVFRLRAKLGEPGISSSSVRFSIIALGAGLGALFTGSLPSRRCRASRGGSRGLRALGT